MKRAALALSCIVWACSCGPAAPPREFPPPPARSTSEAPSASAAPSATSAPFDITILGTSDLHGRLESLPKLAGFVSAVRRKVGADRVVLVDAGDMFQGTLESNMFEGAAVVRAYNALGYDAVAIGNHEFDFGPVGPDATARTPNADARGALKARAKEAHFPFLMADVEDAATSAAPTWEHVLPSTIVDKHGVRVGIVGVTSEDTPFTTISVNFAGLRMIPMAKAVAREAAHLREKGATVVVLAAHAGGNCKNVFHPDEDGACDEDQEVMRLLETLPKGTLDAVVAGHTHQGMATRVNGVPVVQSFANGRAFGRIDLTIDPVSHKVLRGAVRPLTEMSATHYEGEQISPDASLERVILPDIEKAKSKKEEKLGTTFASRVTRHHDHESQEGNLFADLMRRARPKADVALTNGGGLRADLPAGELTYGALFEAMPFDNRFAVITLSGADLRRIVRHNLEGTHGILSVSGIDVEATCNGTELEVTLFRRAENGKKRMPIADADTLTLVTSDFLALGGDGSGFPKDGVVIEDALVRDALEAGLRGRGVIKERELYDPALPRLRFKGERPLRCK